MNLNAIKAKADSGEAIVMLTAYDYTLARILDGAGLDIILVGDSLGMVVRGEENTLQVTIDDMVYHTKMVKRAVKQSLLVADMPFMSYQLSPEQALKNAARLVSEGGAQAVKLEGGPPFCPAITKIINAGIPVMGHLGFTPQALHQIGGYNIKGKSPTTAEKILQEAKLLEKTGVFALVLEMVPAELGAEISRELKIPVIGCGAGPDCDGQVLVTHDILGLYPEPPRFVKQYANLEETITRAVKDYSGDVKARKFPGPEQSF
ncbi:3-methyl-2-oxobutanoate hydroxymethyltransferase [Candidatus Margulisiibacteriota bacterium]